MRTRLSLISLVLLGFLSKAQEFPPKGENEAWTYHQIIASYQALAEIYPNALYLEAGTTDAGRPLSLFLIQAEPFVGDLSLSERANGKLTTLINNGIHPGESCGMDASLIWAKEILANGGPESGQLIAIIPVYNIGGSLQAKPHTRANQNGPEEQGFRGNARNLDLNRDFIKGDALNTFSFWAIYQALKPQIFVDTHTSNGADYPYTLSLIATQADKLAPSLADFQQDIMLPELYEGMEDTWEMIPYVNVFGRTPNNGYAAFLETPRYASGYTALFHSLGFITEAHMFKPYADRVAATTEFLRVLQDFVIRHKEGIQLAYEQAIAWESVADEFPVAWQLDSSIVEALDFKSFDYSYEDSPLGDYKRLRYNRDKIIPLVIDYYPSYKASRKSSLPEYYVLPCAWPEVATRLQYHGIEFERLSEDTVIEVESLYLKAWEHSSRPYEGHFRTEIKSYVRQKQKRLFYAGDILIPTNKANRYFLASVLDPMSVDSYLSWGFFDIIFQQKEHFSPYIFEDEAIAMLEREPSLKVEFEIWKKENPGLQKNSWAVLSFFYERSEYYEDSHLRYPIAEIRRP